MIIRISLGEYMDYRYDGISNGLSLRGKCLTVSFIIFVMLAGSFCGRSESLAMTVISYVGDVKINSGKITGVRPAIRQGDVIETGSRSSCELLINGKNIISIGEQAHFAFNVSDNDSILNLESGQITAVTRKAFTKEGLYLVKTPTVAAAVRGTSFFVKVENADSVYFCVCNGKVDLALPGAGVADSLEAAHHSARRYTKMDDGTIAIDKKAGLLYHGDADLEKIASIIGETIDWTKPDRE
jgi:hypothetical protein